MRRGGRSVGGCLCGGRSCGTCRRRGGCRHPRSGRGAWSPLGRGRPGSVASGPRRAARTWEESMTALDQSSFPAACSSASNSSCSCFQTPGRFHSSRRRQHVIPDPNPSSCGRNSHWMPVCSTNGIPDSTCRSGIRLRPGRRGSRGTGLGSSGSMRCHSRPARSTAAVHHASRPKMLDHPPQRMEDPRSTWLGPASRQTRSRPVSEATIGRLTDEVRRHPRRRWNPLRHERSSTICTSSQTEPAGATRPTCCCTGKHASSPASTPPAEQPTGSARRDDRHSQRRSTAGHRRGQTPDRSPLPWPSTAIPNP